MSVYLFFFLMFQQRVNLKNLNLYPTFGGGRFALSEYGYLPASVCYLYVFHC